MGAGPLGASEDHRKEGTHKKLTDRRGRTNASAWVAGVGAQVGLLVAFKRTYLACEGASWRRRA